MPISETSLSARIVTEITAQKGAPQDPARLKQFADAVAKAVVDEITQNAQATGSVTSGAGSGGAVVIPPGGIT